MDQSIIILSRMAEWKIVYKKEQRNIKDIPYSKIEINNQQTLALQNILGNTQMQENKVKQSKYFTNYFKVEQFSIYFQSLISMTKILYIDPNEIYQHLQSFKIQRQQLQTSNLTLLQTQRTKLIKACFSRRWREAVFTVYVIFYKYATIGKANKLRALILSERGLILQANSNIDQAKCFATISRYLKSFSRLSYIAVLSPDQSIIDIDSINALKQNFENVKVVWMGSKSRESFCPIGSNSYCSLLNMQINNGMRVAYYNKQQIAIWHSDQICLQMLNHITDKFTSILKRQKRIKSFFKDYLYESHQFNQKQFLIRLFSFCYNFVTIEKLDNQTDSSIMDKLNKNCIQELVEKKREISKNAQTIVHEPSSNSSPLDCPICKEKSKNICMKCSQQFQTKFGLCVNKCFEQFHRDRPKYAGVLRNQRIVKDLSIQTKPLIIQHSQAKPLIIQHHDSSNQDNSDSTRATNVYHNIRTMKELREKWDKVIQKEKHELDNFMKMCTMNFIPKKMTDRINLLDTKISLMSKNPQQQNAKVKKQQP